MHQAENCLHTISSFDSYGRKKKSEKMSHFVIARQKDPMTEPAGRSKGLADQSRGGFTVYRKGYQPIGSQHCA